MFNTHYLNNPAWHTISAELGSQQPRLLVGRGRHHSAMKHSQWDAIRRRSFGLFLVTDCVGFAVSPRRFHTPVHSEPHSRERPSIGSSHTFEGHISQSCGADIRRLILSADAWGSIEPPTFVHRFIGTPQPPWPEGLLISLPTRPFLAKPREGLRQVRPRGGNYRH